LLHTNEEWKNFEQRQNQSSANIGYRDGSQNSTKMLEMNANFHRYNSGDLRTSLAG
jgi:hypothetical protein